MKTERKYEESTSKFQSKHSEHALLKDVTFTAVHPTSALLFIGFFVLFLAHIYITLKFILAVKLDVSCLYEKYN